MTDAFLSLRLALDLTTDPRWDADQKKRFAREARSGLVEVCFTRGDFAAAKEYALELLNADPKSGATRPGSQRSYSAKTSPPRPKKEYTQAFADDPTLDPPELQLAGQWQLRATSEADPAKKSAATDKTEEWLKKAVSAHPKNPKPAREYGLWLLSAGKLNAAGPYIDAAHALDPNGKETAVARAVWLLNKKDATSAEPILEGVYKDSPADLNALSLLCLCLSESGDEKKKKRAVELADTLVRQNPKGAAGYAVLGWCLYKNGRKDDAERALVIALNSGQINSDAAYFAARLLADKQKFEDAHKLLVGATGVKQGMFIYRSDAEALLAEVAKKLPEKKEK